MAVNLPPSKPQPKPAPLTPDELARLDAYDATPDHAKDESELLDELRLRSRREAWDKYRGVALIRHLLPKGGQVRRGLMTEVTEASPYKREYVARIRDGIAANYRD